MQTLTPTAVRLNNLSGSAADLDDSPDAPDSSWCTVGVSTGGDWQLASGHYEDVIFDLHVVYPRPNNETNTWARHRWAYPGIRYEIPIGVQFGSWPYRYEKIAGPSWLAIEDETLEVSGDKMVIPDGYGILAGTAPGTAQAAETVTVRVYDQTYGRGGDPGYVDVTFTVEVASSQFCFIDTVNGNDGTATGTISLPFKEISALQDSGLCSRMICYVRTTAEGGYRANPARQFGRVGASDEPMSYVAYPGETVIVDAQDNTKFSGETGTVADTFFSGIHIKDCGQTDQSTANTQVFQRFGGAAQREVLWKMTGSNMFPGTAGDDNCGFYVQFDVGGATGSNYVYLVDNIGQDTTDSTSNGPAFHQVMNAHHCLQERNTVSNWVSGNTGILGNKHDNYDFECRANDTSGCTGQGSREYAGHATGDSSNYLYCWNKAHSDINMLNEGGQTTAQMQVYMLRNSVNNLRAQDSYTINNAVIESIGWDGTATGNVVVGSGGLDSGRNLISSARTSYLGTKGAEVA